MYESVRKRKWVSKRETGLFGGSDSDVRGGGFSDEEAIMRRPTAAQNEKEYVQLQSGIREVWVAV